MSRLNFWEKRGIADVMHTVRKIIAIVAAVITSAVMSTLIHAETVQLEIKSQTQTEPNREAQRKSLAKTQTELTSQVPSRTQIRVKSEKAQSQDQVQDATSPEMHKQTSEQRATKSEQRIMRYPYRWISNYLYRQHLDELANERRERLRTHSEALREGPNRYSSTSHWWYTPWLEARRQWLDATQDYLRDLADLRREQILAESDPRREMFHPLVRPNPAAWGPYGMGPWKPNLGPWGPYP